MTPLILFVEDDASSRLVTQEMMRIIGYDVTAVADGAAALSLAEQGRHFDVLVTDVRLPDVSGVELARRIRMHPHLARIGVLFLSGTSADHAPGERFVLKPFSYEDLQRAIDDLAAG
jgi:CheY-like chemotaxis protein